MSHGFEFTRRLRSVSDRDVMRLRELFLDVANDFDAGTMDDHLLFPLEMTWFYGEPIYHEMSAEQQLMLNRLTFCQNNLTSVVAEATLSVLNYEAMLANLLHGDPETSFYMARETTEETFHLEGFYIIIRKVLDYYGIPFEQCRQQNRSLRSAPLFQRFHGFIGWLRGDLNFYYLTRFPMNIAQKTVERSTIEEPRMHPSVRTFLKNHAVDEARHMRMSREAGKLALQSMDRLSRTVACFVFAQHAARINMVGRHSKGAGLNGQTRIGVLEMCGVPRARAEQAYREWRDRVNQPHDPPHVQRARLYYLRLIEEYVDELAASDRMKQYIKRTVGAAHQDVTRAERDSGLRPLEFGDIERAA